MVCFFFLPTGGQLQGTISPLIRFVCPLFTEHKWIQGLIELGENWWGDRPIILRAILLYVFTHVKWDLCVCACIWVCVCG